MITESELEAAIHLVNQNSVPAELLVTERLEIAYNAAPSTPEARSQLHLGAHVRVFGACVGEALTASLEPADLRGALGYATAMSNSRDSSYRPQLHPVDWQQPVAPGETADPSLSNTRRLALSLLEASQGEGDPSRVVACEVRAVRTRTALLKPNLPPLRDDRTDLVSSVEVVESRSSEGDVRGSGFRWVRPDDEMRLVEAASDARAMIDRLSLPAGCKHAHRIDAVEMTPYAAAQLMRVIALSVNGRETTAGRHCLGDGGDAIGNRHVTLIDDGTNPSSPDSAAHDSEGTRRRRTVLLEDGSVQGLLWDRLAAAEHQKAPTGNAYRRPNSTGVTTAPTNLAFIPFTDDAGDPRYVFTCERILGLWPGYDRMTGDLVFQCLGVCSHDGEPMTTRATDATTSVSQIVAGLTHVGPTQYFLPYRGSVGAATFRTTGISLR